MKVERPRVARADVLGIRNDLGHTEAMIIEIESVHQRAAAACRALTDDTVHTLTVRLGSERGPESRLASLSQTESSAHTVTDLLSGSTYTAGDSPRRSSCSEVEELSVRDRCIPARDESSCPRNFRSGGTFLRFGG